MKQRYFRSSEQVYASVLDHCNAEFGLPAHGQLTAFAHVSDAPKDAAGLLYLCVWDFFCDYDAVRDLLLELLASGAVEEIDRETYWAETATPM